MSEYSRVAKGSFTSTGATKYINLPFVPDTIYLYNYSAANSAPTANAVVSAYWDAAMGQGYALETAVYNSTPVLVADTVVANGFSTYTAGLSLQYGARQQVESATAANPIVFTVANHGYVVGDIVVFEGLYQTSSTGMPQICGMPFVISAVTTNTFSVVWPGNGSNYTALSGSPSGAYVKKVLYPFLYAPGVAFIEAITLGSTTTVTTTAPNNFVVGQEIGFRIPQVWGTYQLNELPNTTIPGSPLNYFVTSIVSSTQFVCNAASSSFTAFDTNQTVASVPGLSFPQVLAVGDVNTGGVAYSGGNFYPSPVINSISTINGPAISGAFVNNTSQGFIVGTGAGTNLTSSVLVGASGNIIYWRALLSDYVASS